MKVLFIADKLDQRMRQGIMWLSAILKAHNFDVSYLNTVDYAEADEFITTYSPNLIAYSCTSGEYQHYNALNAKLKKHKILSVIGGPHATFFGNTFVQDQTNSFDGICVGEGELALLDLCQKLQTGSEYFQTRNWIFKTPDSSIIVNDVRPLIENLDDLPFPDYQLDHKELEKRESEWFWFHRGCPFNCTYCFNHQWRVLYKNLGKTIRVPSPAYCINLIKYRLSLTQIRPKYLVFNDDTFGHSMQWLQTFCELYTREIDLPWETHLYPTMITEERIALMADAGCTMVNTAFETGNEQMRKEILKRPMTNMQIEAAAKLVHQYNLCLRVQNILLLPGEMFQTAWETFRLNARCKPDISTASKFQPYPGLELTEKAIEMGYLTRGTFENNLPDNIHWISLLNFPDKRDLNRINNLLNLFTFGTYFTVLKPLVYILIHLPNSKFHHHIDNITWKVITHRSIEEFVRKRGLKLKLFLKWIYHFFRPSNIRATLRRKISRTMALNLETKKIMELTGNIRR